MLRFVLAPLICCLAFSVMAQKQYLLVGTYSTDTSGGLYVYEWNSQLGTAKYVENAPAKNTSFLTLSTNQQHIYAVSEIADGNGGGGLIHFGFDATKGHLTFKKEVSSLGKNPCHIALNKKNNIIAVANYSSGSALVQAIDKKGNFVLNQQQLLQHKGNSIDTTRQKDPHAHHALFQGKKLFITDLGIDKVKQYEVEADAQTLTVEEKAAVEVKAGNGPRHSVIHPNKKVMYVLNELKGSVTVFSLVRKQWKEMQTISVQPADYSGQASGAAIILSKDGNFLYTSNRGTSNTICIAAVKENFQLEVKGFQPTLGIKPRNINFSPDEKFLLAAHQDSHDIVVFKRDTTSGMLSDTGNRIKVGKPVCLVFTQ